MKGNGMPLFRKRERRDYMGGFLTNPWGPPNYPIPTNGQLGYLLDANVTNTDTAMKHWAVWACVRTIADVISTLPIDLFQGDADPVDPLPDKLVQPSAYASMLQWRHQVMVSLLMRGNAYGLVSKRDARDRPEQVDIIPPDAVQVIVGADGRKRFKVRGTELSTVDMWHLPGPQLPGDLEGMSPLKYAARTIGLGITAEKFASDFFSSGINPTAVLETDLAVTDEQAKLVKGRLREATRDRDFAVLGFGTKLRPWQINAEESQFLETQRVNAAAVCQIFGVPPEMLGVATSGSSVTYANREQRAQDFLASAINPWLARLEESLTQWFGPGQYVKFNTGALLRADLSARYSAHAVGIKAGFLTPNEARGFENLPPEDGGDTLYPPQKGNDGGQTKDEGDGNTPQPG